MNIANGENITEGDVLKIKQGRVACGFISTIYISLVQIWFGSYKVDISSDIVHWYRLTKKCLTSQRQNKLLQESKFTLKVERFHLAKSGS